MLGMRKAHVLVAVLAATVGFGSAFAVDAASYRDLGTVAEGVYLVHGEAGAFRVKAADPITAIVYDQQGELLLAKAMAPGEARSFLLGDAAVVAIVGGGAAVQAKGDGQVQKLDTERRAMELTENVGALDETATVRMPPFLVGMKGQVDGEAENLVVEITSSKGLVYRWRDGAAETNLAALTREPMEARLTADKLDGRIALELFFPAMPSWGQEAQWDEEKARAMAQSHERMKERHQEHTMEAPRAERHERPTEFAIGDLAEVPVLLRFDQAGEVAFDIGEGYGLDASLYDSAGRTIAYLQRGATVSEARSGCGFTCWTDFEGRMSTEVAPEQVAWAVEAGEYLLFVRMGHVEGMVRTANVAELTHLELVAMETPVEDGASIAFETPLLDVWYQDWQPSVGSSVSVLLDGAPVYEARSTVNLGFGGDKVDSSETYDPSLLGAGTVDIEADGLGLPGSQSIRLMTAGKAAEHTDEN